MKLSEIRQKYLKFFEDRGHVVVPSDSLVPENDPSVLFTPAGMNQFKDMFLGKGTGDYTRAASCQKCLRTGDIENVGRTSAHLTFFEMLGNFSFGDYFKKEAIEWAWEFVTGELGLPEERLVGTIYEDDDESFEIWSNVIGLPSEKIFRFGEKENFWPANAPSEGPNGPCGPCSEIHYDQGEVFSCGRPDCGPACNCDRWVEIWNLVFTQFDRGDGGVLDPLPSKNIDTGMGLERTAAVMQGVPMVQECDAFLPILNAAAEHVGVEYDRNGESGPRLRRIADHVRAVTFCISDGVLPGNEGRSYVVRRLLRRAVGDGKQLGAEESFLYKLAPVVAEAMSDVYPEVKQRRDNISRIIQIEEDKFRDTLDQGWRELQEKVERVKQSGQKTLPGKDAFYLADTLGFPIEFTEQVLADQGMTVDRDGYEAELEEQRKRSKAGSSMAADIFATGPMAEIKERAKPTEFVGYESTTGEGKVVGLIQGDTCVQEAEVGEVTIVLDRTPFYGESGGQVGDRGRLGGDGVEVEITDAKKTEGYILHVGKIKKGSVSLGDTLTAEVDADRRAAIRRNHTVTHLLHHALRQVLGEHAEQSGSMVAPDRLRFDFTHFSAVTPEELRKIEEIVNEKVASNEPVVARVMTLDDARARGAIALFGEKYGQRVRMVSAGDYSKELCGGTHCDCTGEIGLFRITSEQSVAAGVRRIEAVTGGRAFEEILKDEKLIQDLCTALDAPKSRLLQQAEQTAKEAKALRKEVERLKSGAARESASDLLASAEEVGGAKVVVRRLEDVSSAGMRQMADSLRKSGGPVALAFGTVEGGKVLFVVALTKDLVERGLHAGKIASEAAKIAGGGGGGRPDMAQAGGKDPSKVDAALGRAKDLFQEGLGA
ncbi:MAG: alanine--tRNA ligase [Planctomycetes bacterium]|nr:alanine--tRNA ligase [Planctomycetota bacterium]